MWRPEELPHQLPGQRDRDRRRFRGDFGRDVASTRRDVIGGNELAHEAGIESFGRGKDPTRDGPVDGAPGADNAGKKPARARFRHDAAPHERKAEAGVVSRDTYVHRQGHRDTDTHGRAVDRGDHRFRAVEDADCQLAAEVAARAAQRLEPGRAGREPTGS